MSSRPIAGAMERPKRCSSPKLHSTVPRSGHCRQRFRQQAEFSQLPAAVGALAVVETPTSRFERAADFCVLLEDIQDPGNAGSILRSAAAAGVAQVFLSPQCVFAWSPKVLRAAQGAHFHLEIYEDVDLPAWAKSYRGSVAAAVAAGGKLLYAADLTGPLALAI
ncbi:MAG: RNA methyltransferase, partial [Betaproteobacteria bacterium]